MRTVPGQLKAQLIWVLGSAGLTGAWLFFVYFVEPTEIDLVATAFATAALIAMVQAHFKK